MRLPRPLFPPSIGILALLAAPIVCGPVDAHAEAPWTPLFNGRDLTGWTVKIAGHPVGENYGNTFRVENGLLKVAYDRYSSFGGRFGHLFYQRPLSHYRLRVEYRFVGVQTPGAPAWALRNSGVMLHAQSPTSMRQDQAFPVSLEVQFLGGAGTGERTTGNLCTPGTDVVIKGKLAKLHCTNSNSETFHGAAWVTAEVEVRGNRTIKHLINGRTVLSYSQPQLDEREADARLLVKAGDKTLGSGYIALQAESHPVEFRRIELQELPPD